MVWLVRVLVGLACIGLLAWMALAVYFSPLEPAWLRAGLTALVPVGAIVALILVRPLRRVPAVILGAFVVVLGAWLAIPPSNERDWQPDVATLALRGHPRGPRDRAQRPERGLPQRDRFQRAPRGPRAGSLAAPLPGPLPHLLGIALDRPHHHELGVRGRSVSGHLDRDAQGEGRGVFRATRLLPPVRARLRGRGRARRRAPAHELPRRGCLRVPVRCTPGGCPAAAARVSRRRQPAARPATVVQRADGQLHDDDPASRQALRAPVVVELEALPERLHGRAGLRERRLRSVHALLRAQGAQPHQRARQGGRRRPAILGCGFAQGSRGCRRAPEHESSRRADPSTAARAARGALPGPGRLHLSRASRPCRSHGRPPGSHAERHHHGRAELADPRRAPRAGPPRRLRRAPRGGTRRAASGHDRREGRSGPALRPGRAVVPARPEGGEARAPAGGGGLRLCVPLPRGGRPASRCVRPSPSHRRGPVQLVAHRGLRFEGRVGGRPAGRQLRAALRSRSRSRSTLPSCAPETASCTASSPSRSSRCTGWRCGIAGRASALRSRPPPGPPRPRPPATTWWRRGSRCR